MLFIFSWILIWIVSSDNSSDKKTTKNNKNLIHEDNNQDNYKSFAKFIGIENDYLENSLADNPVSHNSSIDENTLNKNQDSFLDYTLEEIKSGSNRSESNRSESNRSGSNSDKKKSTPANLIHKVESFQNIKYPQMNDDATISYRGYDNPGLSVLKSHRNQYNNRRKMDEQEPLYLNYDDNIQNKDDSVPLSNVVKFMNEKLSQNKNISPNKITSEIDMKGDYQTKKGDKGTEKWFWKDEYQDLNEFIVDDKPDEIGKKDEGIIKEPSFPNGFEKDEFKSYGTITFMGVIFGTFLIMTITLLFHLKRTSKRKNAVVGEAFSPYNQDYYVNKQQPLHGSQLYPQANETPKFTNYEAMDPAHIAVANVFKQKYGTFQKNRAVPQLQQAAVHHSQYGGYYNPYDYPYTK